MVKILHEWTQRHAVVDRQLALLGARFARVVVGRVVPIEGARVDNHPVVSVKATVFWVRQVIAEELPIRLEFGFLFGQMVCFMSVSGFPVQTRLSPARSRQIQQQEVIKIRNSGL